MILGDSFTPLSQLSSAFLAPKSPLHLQFAYFESALAVEFLVERFGLPAPERACWTTWVPGMSMNESLPRRTKMSLDQIDEILPNSRGSEPKGSPPKRPGRSRICRRRGFDGLSRLAREASQELLGTEAILGARLVVEEKVGGSQEPSWRS